MSFSKKDRKFQDGNGKTFPDPVTDEPLATTIAGALRQEFGGMPSAYKTIARLTRSNERAVRNWFEGRNSPSAENLVILMRHSDLILRTVLALVNRQDLGVAVGLAKLRRELVDAITAIDGLPMESSGQGPENIGQDGT